MVEETLAGRGDQIKEYVVGTAVFDRGDAYDPRVDSVVRVEATRLRNRLRYYYQYEGTVDAVSIELPKGSYVPLFQSLQVAVPTQARRRPLLRRATVWIAATTLLLTVGAAWWIRRMRPFTQVHSLAVLPFENLSGDRSQNYLADGITEQLTTKLGHLRAIRVLSYSAVTGYSHPSKPRSAVAGHLKVDAWVEGSVARSGNRVLITERLIQSGTDRTLWSQSYERDVGELSTLQKEPAQGIAAAVGADWPSGESSPREALRINPEAYDYYLRARFHSRHQTKSENQTSIADLQRAVAIDPSFASAYADLAQSYVWRLFLFASSRERVGREGLCSRRASSLAGPRSGGGPCGARPSSLDVGQPLPS